MKVILEEQARGSPAPGLPNHHLPQALFLLSDFSRVLRFAPTFWAAAAILCKLACGSAYLCSLLDQPRHWKEFGTPCVMSHSVTLLTIGSYQRGKNLSSSLLTLSTQLPPKYACTFSHVPQNTYESWRTKLDSDLAFHLEWDGISLLLSALCVRSACSQLPETVQCPRPIPPISPQGLLLTIVDNCDCRHLC